MTAHIEREAVCVTTGTMIPHPQFLVGWWSGEQPRYGVRQ